MNMSGQEAFDGPPGADVDGAAELQRLKAGSGRSLAVDILGLVSFVAVLIALYGALIWAPTEREMGDVQRIFYFHTPSAWVALGPAFTIVFITSILYLVKKDLKYDRVAAASAEIGVMFTTIVLLTGPLWAKPIWGAYWTWDPRLTTTLVLWFIYIAYLMLRSASASGHKRARLCAVFGIVGWLDVPIVFMSIRWWRTIHPTVITANSMNLDSRMATVLMYSLASFTLLFVYMLIVRVRQEDFISRVERLRHQVLSR
jgi:heme exporter protein C